VPGVIGRVGELLVQLADKMDSLWTVGFLAIERFRQGSFEGETRGQGEGCPASGFLEAAVGRPLCVCGALLRVVGGTAVIGDCAETHRFAQAAPETDSQSVGWHG